MTVSQSVIERIMKEKGEGELLGLFFDFDGTISEIVDSPEEARILPGARKFLETLAESDDIVAGVISGREIEDLKEKVGVSGIVFSGNHGAQLEIFGESYTLANDEELSSLNHLAMELAAKATAFPGMIVEDKKFSVSVHTRLTDDWLLDDLTRLVTITTKKHRNLKIREGKRVLEVLLESSADKGQVLGFILEKIEETFSTTVFPVYFGDDVTDNYVYEYMRVRDRGISIFVQGRDPLHLDADFELNGPLEVVILMEDLIGSGKCGRQR